MDETFKCEHCGGTMTPQDELCPSCGKPQGVNSPRESYEQLLEIIERLHGERDAALVGVEDTKRLRGYLAALAGALAEGAAAGAAGAFPIEHDLAWFYKARAALAAAGYSVDHPVPADHPQHAAAWARATELVEHLDPQAHQFWTTHAAEVEGERPAYMKIAGDLCMHCERFGGAPERVRMLELDLKGTRAVAEASAARIERGIQELAERDAKFKELSDAAQIIAADNKAKDDEIAALRTKLQEQTDGRVEAEEALKKIVEHAREQANQIDDMAARASAEASAHHRCDDLEAKIAELSEQVAKVSAPTVA